MEECCGPSGTGWGTGSLVHKVTGINQSWSASHHVVCGWAGGRGEEAEPECCLARFGRGGAQTRAPLIGKRGDLCRWRRLARGWEEEGVRAVGPIARGGRRRRFMERALVPTPPATWGRTSSLTQPLHLFIVHHEPLHTLPPVRPSDSMKKLFGRDKPKAVKVTPGGRDDASALGEVRSPRLPPPRVR